MVGYPLRLYSIPLDVICEKEAVWSQRRGVSSVDAVSQLEAPTC